MNLQTLGFVILYGLLFVLLFCFYDKTRRKQLNRKRRLVEEWSVLTLHSILLLILSFFAKEDYVFPFILLSVLTFTSMIFVIPAHREGDE